jgi:hypothetical protein
MLTPAEKIERAKAVDILETARRYGAVLKRVGPAEWCGPCPACGGTDRFSVNTRKQVFNCRGAEGGDVIALVEHIERCSFTFAVGRLVGGGGGGRGDWQPSTASGNQPRAGAIWGETLPLAGTDGEAYLARRGIAFDDVPDHGGLRWHPACPWETGTAPCVVAQYTDATTAEPRGIWRRPIDGQHPRSLGPTAGCVIRLWPDDMVELGLVLGEGVETTLAAATRITHKGTYLRPAWAAGSAGNMAEFPVLPGVESLTLLVDHDANGVGQHAAEQCALRWEDAWRNVIRLTPGECGADFNDLVRP